MMSNRVGFLMKKGTWGGGRGFPQKYVLSGGMLG